VLNAHHGILQDVKHKMALIPQNCLLQGQIWANREFSNPILYETKK
jgi:hypothetical protein